MIESADRFDESGNKDGTVYLMNAIKKKILIIEL
jgi:hypothetical protein